MNEIFNRFPEIIKSLLQKISQSSYKDDEISIAKDKLIAKLNSITVELEKLTALEGEELTEEQKNIINSLEKK